MGQIKQWVKKLFYLPEQEKVTEKSFSRIMLSSVLGILICGICLAGLTWAWFSDSVTSGSESITAANFSVSITVKDSDNAIISPAPENGSYTLSAGAYTVTVKANGNATTGYCRVEFGGSSYHTVQLYPVPDEGKPQSLTFTVNVSETSTLMITSQWGTFAGGEQESLISDSFVL